MRYNEKMLKRVLVFLMLLVILFVSSRSFLLGKLFFLHDFTHVARIAEMSRALQDGDFPVQWSKNFGYGYGMPLFLFYGPFPYYIGAFLYQILNSASWSMLLLLIIVNIVTVLGSYRLGKQLSGYTGGVIFAALYTLAPYRAVNLFLRGAINELWGMALLPWLVLGWYLMIKKHRLGWLYISLSTAIIILSHNLSALYFVPLGFLIGLLLFLWKRKKINGRYQDLVSLLVNGLLGSMLGFGLSAFYALPALLEKSFTRLDEQILTGYFDYHNHFLYLRQFLLDNWKYGGSEWGPNDGINFFLGYGVLFGLGLAVFHALKNFKRESKQTSLSLFLLFMTMGGLILLTTQKSLWLWENLPMIAYLQFPWRLLSAIVFIATVIVSISFSTSFKRKRALFLTIIIITLITSFRYFVPAAYYDSNNGPYYTDATRIQTEMSGILPDYIPKTFNPDIEPFQQLVKESELLTVTILKDATSQKILLVKAKEPVPITISIANFPGWKAYLDGAEIQILTSENGLIEVNLPEGEHLLSLNFGATKVRMWSYLISTIAVILLIVKLFSTQTKKQN